MALLGFARASTEDQQTHRQLDELQAAGCHTVLQEHASGGDRGRPDQVRVRDGHAPTPSIECPAAEVITGADRIRMSATPRATVSVVAKGSLGTGSGEIHGRASDRWAHRLRTHIPALLRRSPGAGQIPR